MPDTGTILIILAALCGGTAFVAAVVWLSRHAENPTRATAAPYGTPVAPEVDPVPQPPSGVQFGNMTLAENGDPALDEIIRKPCVTPHPVTFGGDQHIFSIGPTRSGKGRRLLAPAIINAPPEQSLIVVDPKGELAMWTAAHREKIGSKVAAIDPFGELAKAAPHLNLPSAGFNPMRWLNPEDDDYVDDCKAIAEAICPVESKSEPIWDRAAQDLITGLIMYNRLVNPEAGLVAVRQDLGRTPKQWANLIYGGVRDSRPDENGKPRDPRPSGLTADGKDCVVFVARDRDMPALETKLGKFADIQPEDRMIKSIIEVAKSATDFLDSTPIVNDLNKPGVDFQALKNEAGSGTTVYLVIPPKRLETHAKWLRMVIVGAIEALRKKGLADRSRPPVLFILDEFPQLGRMQAVETGVQLNAGYGIKFWIVVQNIVQLQDLYANSWETFTSAGALTAFAPRDPTTSDYLAKLSGERGVEVEGTGASMGLSLRSFNQSSSSNIQRRENIMPHQSRQMRQGMMLVRLPSATRGENLLITFAEDFTKRADIPPEVRALG